MEKRNAYWKIPDKLNVDEFDFSWRPSPREPLFIHQFGTQHQKTGGPRLIRQGATQIKYQDEFIATALPDMSKWVSIVDSDIDHIEFDYSWHHDETEPLMNYVFGDQFGSAEETNTLIYKQGEKLPVKYMTYPVAKIVYRPLDIIFLSNGEVNEQHRYDRLCSLVDREVKWVKGINGRENAIKHAATLSTTKWFILFPGKLYADENFDFNFQPMRLNEPKHYIFYAKNPVNDLVYGHQAAVCYNQQLVLNTVNHGLDFTMSALHDVVPMISGIAEYNSDIIMTWRTAFREAIKLGAENSKESMERLSVWTTQAKGKYCEWSVIGAQDGIDFYQSVNGNYEELIKSFSWDWLNHYYSSKYNIMDYQYK
jgi:hypothetical protein